MKVLRGTGEYILVEKHSRFICRCAPAASETDARAVIEAVRASHRTASHHVYAFGVRENGDRFYTRHSDDGEPQGTAGLPTLDVLQKQGLADCAIVVTRYFGGTLLGAGGLARAYSQAASTAIEAAGVVTMAACALLQIKCAYSFYAKLQALVAEGGGVILNTEFAEEVSMGLRIREKDADGLVAEIIDASNGQAECEITGSEFAAT